MKKALIINEGYSNNLGDQAINKSIKDIFIDNKYEVNFLFLSNPLINGLPKYDYLNSKSLKVKKTFFNKLKSYLLFFYWYIKFGKLIKQQIQSNNYDIIAIGGGQLIISSGTFSLSSFSITLFWFTYLIKKYSNSKLYLISIGSSKKFNFFEKIILSKTLKRFNKIWVRDHFSKNILKTIFKKEVDLIPDIAFYETNNKKTTFKKNIALIGITSYKEVFLRYNSNKISKDVYYDEIYEIIKAYKQIDMTIKLFYTTITDAVESLNFQKYINKKHNIQINICNINNLTDLIIELEKSKHVYSGRMHALILGYKSNCEVKPYLISQKLKSFNQEYIVKSKNIKSIKKEIINKLTNIFD